MSAKGNQRENARAKAELLKDIYGAHNGASYDFGLAEKFDSEDFNMKLLSLERMEVFMPGILLVVSTKEARTVLFRCHPVSS